VLVSLHAQDFVLLLCEAEVTGVVAGEVLSVDELNTHEHDQGAGDVVG